ncbi:unannotated protein [freshwater metagenome]|uniref:Unannotated protein n=1 Tax=freshwater metagenome TaxID=449393 RepID=A0A6J6BX86_9ZZZZ
MRQVRGPRPLRRATSGRTQQRSSPGWSLQPSSVRQAACQTVAEWVHGPGLADPLLLATKMTSTSATNPHGCADRAQQSRFASRCQGHRDPRGVAPEYTSQVQAVTQISSRSFAHPSQPRAPCRVLSSSAPQCDRPRQACRCAAQWRSRGTGSPGQSLTLSGLESAQTVSI